MAGRKPGLPPSSPVPGTSRSRRARLLSRDPLAPGREPPLRAELRSGDRCAQGRSVQTCPRPPPTHTTTSMGPTTHDGWRRDALARRNAGAYQVAHRGSVVKVARRGKEVLRERRCRRQDICLRRGRVALLPVPPVHRHRGDAASCAASPASPLCFLPAPPSSAAQGVSCLPTIHRVSVSGAARCT